MTDRETNRVRKTEADLEKEPEGRGVEKRGQRANVGRILRSRERTRKRNRKREGKGG